MLRDFRETKFLGMESFGSRDESTLTASIDEVDRSNLYIGIFGGRYGSGITEAEYRRARDNGIKCLIYFKDPANLAAEQLDAEVELQYRLERLKQELRTKHTIYEFVSSDKLAARVAADLHRWLVDDYLTPLLDDATRGQAPRAEAQTALQAIKEPGWLGADLLHRLRASRFLVGGGTPKVQEGGEHPAISVFFGNYEQLRDVYLDPEPVYQRVNLDEFVGRAWLVEAVDDFLNRYDRGYFLLEADAGLGKTSFLAWLTRQRSYIHHFTELAPGLDGVAPALKSLTAQIVSAFQMDEGAEGILPPGAERPEYFARLLKRASDKRNGRKIVIVADALDESAPLGHNVLGLPSALPPGVFVIASMRPVDVTLHVEAGSTPRVVYAGLTAEQEQNQADMRLFLERAAGSPGIRDALRRSGYTGGQFVQTLLEKCRGVWIYLHFVVREIERGERLPLNLESLPDGMMQYYARYWKNWRDGKEGMWYETYLPVLATLAAAREALPLNRICALAGIVPTPHLRRVLSEKWRPFLAISGIGPEKVYRFYHATLRDFFEGHVDRSHLPAGEAALLSELVERTSAAHWCIADSYLEAWGGLEQGLPKFHEAAAVHPAYAYRHLAAHLQAAGRLTDLHCLLALSDADGRPLWFGVRERAADTSGFLADITRGLQAAVAEGPAGIGRELFYSLTLASFRVTKFPPGLLVEALGKGVLAYRDAILYARQMIDPGIRGWALLTLVPAGPAAEREALVDEALRAATPEVLEKTDTTVSMNVMGLLARLGRVEEAVSLAHFVPDLAWRGFILSRIASECIFQGRVSQALEAIRIIPHDRFRTHLIELLVGAWLAIGNHEDALLTALCENHEPLRGRMFKQILATAPATLLDRIFTAILDFSEPGCQARGLSAMVSRCQELGVNPLAGCAMKALQSTCETFPRPVAAQFLTPLLAGAGEARQAVISALSFRHHVTQPAITATLAAVLSRSGEWAALLQLLEHAVVHKSEVDQIRFRLALTGCLGAEDRRESLAAIVNNLKGGELEDATELLLAGVYKI